MNKRKKILSWTPTILVAAIIVDGAVIELAAGSADVKSLTAAPL